MTDVKLQLPEQEFEDSEEYIKEKLVPACKALSELVEVFFQGDICKTERTTSNPGTHWSDIDVPVMVQKIEKVSFDTNDYPKFKGNERRRIIFSIDGREDGECSFRIVKDGEPIGLNRVKEQFIAVDGPGEYWVQSMSMTGGKFVLKSLKITAVYF